VCLYAHALGAHAGMHTYLVGQGLVWPNVAAVCACRHSTCDGLCTTPNRSSGGSIPNVVRLCHTQRRAQPHQTEAWGASDMAACCLWLQHSMQRSWPDLQFLQENSLAKLPCAPDAQTGGMHPACIPQEQQVLHSLPGSPAGRRFVRQHPPTLMGQTRSR
jgi:hypothetical protein